MLPLHKLAAQILAWGALSALSMFLTYILGTSALAYIFVATSMIFLMCLLDRVMTFKFVYENTREQDESSNPPT